jgi:hypothetical protein
MTPVPPAGAGGRSRGRVSPVVWIMLAAVAARAWLLFRTPYVPGVNGAYYLVQARALLERGALAFPDLPLTFHLHAALAWSLAQLTGMAQADAILWAVKLCDAVLPPLVAWPVFVLVRRWARPRGQGDAVPLAAAALACLAAPWFRIVGDLQKNSLALVWLALLAVTLHGWLAARTPRRGVAVLAALLLLGLTHIGVLGAALALLAAVLAVFLARQGGFAGWRPLLPWLGAGVLLLVATVAFVGWRYDPSRILRLLSALTHPAQFSFDGGQMPIPPGSAKYVLRWAALLGFAAAVVPALAIAWRRRSDLPAADVALVAGGAGAVLAITGPYFSMDKSLRFYLIALLPAIIVAAFAVPYIATAWRRRVLLGLVLLIGIGGTVRSLPRGGGAILSDAAMRELQSLIRYIPNPEHTLIVTQHGAEWWTAWLLRTRVAQPDALRPEDWRRYDAILFLDIKSGLLANTFGGGGPPPGPGRGPGPGGPRPAPPGRGAPPPPAAPIPPNAEVLHEGATLRLARIATPPDFVLRRDALPLPRGH